MSLQAASLADHSQDPGTGIQVHRQSFDAMRALIPPDSAIPYASTIVGLRLHSNISPACEICAWLCPIRCGVPARSTVCFARRRRLPHLCTLLSRILDNDN